MKCPHCTKNISAFSTEMHRIGKIRTCPHCGGNFTRHVDLKFVALLTLPALVISMGLQPVLGSFSSVPCVVILVLFGHMLKALPETSSVPPIHGTTPEKKD